MERVQHALLNRGGVFAREPRAAERAAQKSDERAYAKLKVLLGQCAGEARQRIEQMCQSHEVVIATHGMPVLGEQMLISVALMFFNQIGYFDTPAVSGGEIAALVEVIEIDCVRDRRH